MIAPTHELKLGELFPTRPLLRLPERLPICEFITQHRRLSARYSSRRGKIDLGFTPHVIEPLKSFEDPKVRTITLMWASQCQKTTTVENMMFYITAQSPQPMMWVCASEKAKNAFVTERLKPTINESPRFTEELANHGRTITAEKIDFRGAPLFFALADSEADLAQRSIGKLFLDEIDKFPQATAKEGSPIDQARARLRTFPNAKVVQSSTPTSIDGAVYQQWLLSDQREWEVPCLGCGEYGEWKFTDIKWDERPRDRSYSEHARLMLIEPDNDAGEEPVKVWWECPNCHHRVETKGEKSRMNSAGRWVPRRPVSEHHGYHLNALASPHVSFLDTAKEWMLVQHAKDRGDLGPRKMFRIHQEGLPFQPARSRLSEDAILSRVVSLPRGKVPDWADFTTLGMDVQGDRVVWVEMAWGVAQVRGHVVNYGEIKGEIVALHEQLNMLIGMKRSVPLARAFIDSGDGNTTADVYNWTNTHNLGVRPIKGRVGLSDEHSNRKFISDSRGAEHNDKLLILEVNHIKDFFAKLMERELESGLSITFPLEVADDVGFQRQMVSEERRAETSPNGKTRSGWFTRTGYGANHLWDCAIYATSGAIHYGVLNATVAAPKVRRRPRIKATGSAVPTR